MEKNTVLHETREMNGWIVWSVTGKIETTNAAGVGEEGEKILDSTDKLALDLANVTYVSSAGLRVLLRIAKKAKAASKTFSVCRATGMVKVILEEAGIDMLNPIYDSLDKLS